MKEIKLLMERVEDELKDAKCYAKLALEYKQSDPETAELFYKLSGEEMNHMSALHRSVITRIDNFRQKGAQPPEAMLAVYEYLHNRNIEEAGEIGALQAMYKK